MVCFEQDGFIHAGSALVKFLLANMFVFVLNVPLPVVLKET